MRDEECCRCGIGDLPIQRTGEVHNLLYARTKNKFPMKNQVIQEQVYQHENGQSHWIITFKIVAPEKISTADYWKLEREIDKKIQEIQNL